MLQPQPDKKFQNLSPVVVTAEFIYSNPLIVKDITITIINTIIKNIATGGMIFNQSLIFFTFKPLVSVVSLFDDLNKLLSPKPDLLVVLFVLSFVIVSVDILFPIVLVVWSNNGLLFDIAFCTRWFLSIGFLPNLSPTAFNLFWTNCVFDAALYNLLPTAPP